MWVVLRNKRTGKYFISSRKDRDNLVRACSVARVEVASEEIKDFTLWKNAITYANELTAVNRLINKTLNK